VLSDELALRPCNWLRARDVSETEAGQLVCEDEEVGQVAKKIIQLTAMEKEGKMKSVYVDDVLTRALGNPEHPGR
jgi:hypothetical protein